jgi:ribokinase
VHVDTRSGERSFFPLAAPHRKVIEPGELEREYILQADYLLLDGFHPEASLQAAEWMREAGKQVMLDANVHHGPPDAATFSLVQRTDYLICSSGFLQALAKTPQLDQAAQVVLGLGPHTIVQTEGEKGSYTFTHRESFHTPAFPVSVVDTTGAGDVFHGAYLVGLLHGWDARKCARFASAAAAFKCQKLGREGYPKLPELPFI